MSFKLFGVCAPVVLGGLYAGGMLGGSAYTREVGAPPAKVMAALTDLDITRAPGSPGTDPTRSGGVRPTFRLERGADSMTWVVMAGDRVATRMTAYITPIDGGARTRVTASVARGDAPDDVTSPAFRSTGITLGLFGIALEDELNSIAAPNKWSAKCEEVMQRIESGAMAPATDGKRSFANGAKTIMAVNAMHGELMAAGCNPATAKRPKENIGSGMRMAAPFDMEARRDRNGRKEVSFAPGQPMVDVSR